MWSSMALAPWGEHHCTAPAPAGVDIAPSKGDRRVAMRPAPRTALDLEAATGSPGRRAAWRGRKWPACVAGRLRVARPTLQSWNSTCKRELKERARRLSCNRGAGHARGRPARPARRPPVADCIPCCGCCLRRCEGAASRRRGPEARHLGLPAARAPQCPAWAARVAGRCAARSAGHHRRAPVVVQRRALQHQQRGLGGMV